MFRSFMALVSWGSAEPWILQELSKWHLEDFDCVQHSSLVDWTSLGNEAAAFNRAWRVKTAPPVHLCPSDLAESKNLREPRRWTGEVGVVLKQPEVAADECPLGAFTAAVMDLICASNCRPEHAVSQQLWSRALRFHRSETGETFANVPSSTGAAWLFGTSAWPVAQLLSKWASNCTQRLPKDPRAAPCSHQPLLAFRTALHRMADATLANVLEASGPKALIFDARLDHFASASLQVLRELAQSTRGHQRFSEYSERRFPHCSVEVATKEVLLLYLRLLGPTVPAVADPLGQMRTESLSTLLASIPMVKLLAGGWPLFAMLAASGLTTWRSHHLYPNAQVQVSDVTNVLKVANEMDPRVSDLTRAGSSHVHRKLWHRLASNELPSLQPIWPRISKWLLQAPEGTPPVVFMTMMWGSMGNQTWTARFLDRAMVVGIPRFIFISPDGNLLEDCEEVAQSHGRKDSYKRLLCVRSFSRFMRPYDVNNYAKFVLLPLLLALGMNYAWLDIDIFVVQNPTSRLLQLADVLSADVLTTDHFDESCLNHGVIFVKASDRTLHWILRYIRWMHVNPFGHDQNGWDALLKHSILNEPFTPPEPNVSLQILDTGLEFLTLTGWAGSTADLTQALLLHLTRTTPIDGHEKRSTFFTLLDATLTSTSREDDLQVLHSVINAIRKDVPQTKRPCYEGVHVAVEPLVHDGTYWLLFK